MTAREAVEILNRRNHRGSARWTLHSGNLVRVTCRVTADSLDLFDFEAVAIAEWYERRAAEKKVSDDKSSSK